MTATQWLALLGATALASGLLFVRPRRGGFRSAADRAEGFAGRVRWLRTVARFHLPAPAFWRLECYAAPGLGLRPTSRRGFAWGPVEVAVEREARPARRGVHRTPPPRLFVRDALGFSEREVPLAGEGAELTVYPRVWEQLPPELALTLLAEGPEARGVGLEDVTRYRGVRPYAAGDPLRRIHWKATARMGEPMVREYAPVRATGVWLYLDTAGAQQVFVDHAAELAASLAVRLESEGLRVGLAWPGGRLLPEHGREPLRRVFRVLALLSPGETPEPPPLPPAGVNLLVLTQHAPDPVIEGALRARARAARVHLLLFPEGIFLRPGEAGRPVWGRTEGMRRIEARRTLLAAAGVRTYVFRGNERVRFA